MCWRIALLLLLFPALVLADSGSPSSDQNGRLGSRPVTVQPTGPNHFSSDVAIHGFAYLVGTDTVEAGTTNEQIVATAHAAQTGDILRFTSGSLSGSEVWVFSTSTNLIVLAENLDTTPSPGDTFQILRYNTPQLVDGKLQVDVISGGGGGGSGTEYTEGATDASITGTAMLMEGAADTLLPVQGTVADGVLVNLGANNDITGTVTANAGTNLNTSALALETSVDGIEALLTTIDADTSSLAAEDFATETTLGSILTELGQKTEPANTQIVGDGSGALTVDGTVAATQSGTWDEVGINDSGNSITVDNPQLSVVGSGTEATALRVTVATDSTGVLSVDDNGSSLTVDGTVGVSGTVAVTQSGTWDEVGINDSGNSITVDGTVAVSNSFALDASVDGVETLLGTSNTNTGNSATSLGVIDDWDESDRAKVNPIVGQAGVQGGSGAVSATTQRVTLATDVALPAGTNAIGKVDHATTGIGNGRKVVASAGTAEAIAGSTAAKWVCLTAETDNTNKIVVGGSGVIAALATRQGTPLSAGEDICLPCDNLADIYIDAETSTEGVTFTYGT